MRNYASHAVTSLVTHALLGALVAFMLFMDPPQVRGSAGLRGARVTRISMLVDTSAEAKPVAEKTPEKTPEQKPVEKAPEKIVEKKIAPPPVKEGISVPEKPKVATALPSEVKNKAREIEREEEKDHLQTSQSSAAQAEPEASEGNSESAPAGAVGQSGTGETEAVEVGNSDRSNEMGIYLKILHARVQKNLAVPFDLEKAAITKLRIQLSTSGMPTEIRVVESSGSKKLDLLAVNAARKALPVGALSSPLEVTIPVTFRAKTI